MTALRKPRKPGEGLASFPSGRRGFDRHTIAEIRFREEDAHLNYILCDCGWQGPPEDHPGHRREMIRGNR